MISFHEDSVLQKKVTLNVSDKKLDYTLKDLGITIDKEKTLNNIKSYQNKLNYF